MKLLKKTHIKAIAVLLAAGITVTARAEVTAEEANQLGSSRLTLFGAEKAGNKDGTIPEYNEQNINVVVDSKNPNLPSDPYASEKPMFSITAQNVDKYADKLDGMVGMFKKYPDFRMDIYPSHRSSSLPKYVLDNTLKNATQCKLVQNELVLQGCYGGIPFPIPKTGNQVMWNHLTAFEFSSAVSNTRTYVVPTGGSWVLVNESIGVQQFPGYNPRRVTPLEGKEQYWQLRVDFAAPTRQVGEKLVLLDPFDPINFGRRAYSYIPGQRRVKLAPDLAYDTPPPTTGGASTIDDSKGFAGALDRYDFKLIGKKEKYIIANSFKTSDLKICPPEKILTQRYPSPDCVRWELHRVWEVVGTLKPGFRHIYHKRHFYWDEDGYAGGAAENYDAAKKLYRITLVASYPLGKGNGTSTTPYVTFDLNTGLYGLQGTINCGGCGYYAAPAKPVSFFSPEALAAEGVR